MGLVGTLYTGDYPCTSVLEDSLPWLGSCKKQQLDYLIRHLVGFVDDREE